MSSVTVLRRDGKVCLWKSSGLAKDCFLVSLGFFHKIQIHIFYHNHSSSSRNLTTFVNRENKSFCFIGFVKVLQWLLDFISLEFAMQVFPIKDVTGHLLQRLKVSVFIYVVYISYSHEYSYYCLVFEHIRRIICVEVFIFDFLSIWSGIVEPLLGIIRQLSQKNLSLIF